MGVTVRSVQNYEAGKSVPYRHLRHIESLTNVPPGWLLAGGAYGPGELGELSTLCDSLRRQATSIQEQLEVLTAHLEQLRQQREISASLRRPRQ